MNRKTKVAIFQGKQPRYGEHEALLSALARQFQLVPMEQAEVILVIGGDGSMVDAAKQYQALQIPLYGISRGTVGFLLNEHDDNDDFTKEVNNAMETTFPLLEAVIEFYDQANTVKALAFNDVWTKAINSHGQGAKHRILVNGEDIMNGHPYDFFMGDGIIVCTPGGSTAYSRSAGGIILDPMENRSIGLTPIAAYIPHDFRPLVLPESSIVTIEMMEDDKRKHLVVADNQGFTGVRRVTIRKSELSVKLLFKERLSYWHKTQGLRFPWQR